MNTKHSFGVSGSLAKAIKLNLAFFILYTYFTEFSCSAEIIHYWACCFTKASMHTSLCIWHISSFQKRCDTTTATPPLILPERPWKLPSLHIIWDNFFGMLVLFLRSKMYSLESHLLMSFYIINVWDCLEFLEISAHNIGSSLKYAAIYKPHSLRSTRL